MRLRRAISSNLNMTCSAGIAHNKIVAKLGSSLNKPNKQALILPRGVRDMMQVNRCSSWYDFTADRNVAVGTAHHFCYLMHFSANYVLHRILHFFTILCMQDVPIHKIWGLGGKLGTALEEHFSATTAG
jgi:hypothetical protein